MNTNKLWTKNFTIITIGTIISMFGAAVTDFSLGMLILDKTNSTFLYSLFFVFAMAPKTIVPLFAGPFIDRFSRRKLIYILDFISCGMFVCLAILFYFDFFSYPFFLLLAVLFGSVGSFYHVTYDSFYPMLISEGNFSKAYSISSLIYPLASTIMIPVAASVYESVGLFPLFVFNSICYFVAAVFETQIQIEESQIQKENTNFEFKEEFKEGLNYLKAEKGLLAVTIYFMVIAISGGVIQTLFLPYFNANPNLTTQQYSLVISTSTLGRMIGALIQYRIVYPKEKRFSIATFVYASVCIIDMIFFFSPYPMMLGLYLVYGMLAVTSFNIRTSATQSYVPNEKRGRFNGIFSVFSNVGAVIGQLIGGVLGEFIFIPYIIAVCAFLNLLAVYFIIYRNKKEIIPIYNRAI